MVEKLKPVIKLKKLTAQAGLLSYARKESLWNSLTPDLQKEIDDLITKLNCCGILTYARYLEIAIKLEEQIIEQDYRYRVAKEKKVQSILNMELDINYENPYKNEEGLHISTLSQGLILSLSNIGKVDIEYISKITGNTIQDVIKGLKGTIFQDPTMFEECFYKGWVTKEEYLSGNIYKKWQEAKAANIEYQGLFSDNLKALKEVMPERIQPSDIYITLGSPWIPQDMVAQFVRRLLSDNYVEIAHDQITGSWQITRRGNAHSYNSKIKWGTNRISAYDIIEDSLNGREVVVKDKIDNELYEKNVNQKKKFKYKVNVDETNLAIEKQKAINQAFIEWVWNDEKRTKTLTSLYYSKFGCYKKRRCDGSFLTFPGLANGITLFPYQKDAVARIIFSPNTLLAHDVGSGKTYEMIAAGMELRRMKISKKNLYIVPNSIIDQWESIFQIMYPEANILKISPKSFTPSRRNSILSSIRDGDFDGIIMAHSSFDMIETSKSTKKEELEEEIRELEIVDFKNTTTNTKVRLNALRKRLAAMEEVPEDEEEIYFEDLHIDRLFIDEAHYYKNVPYDTKMGSVSGLNPQGSDKCKSMLEKIRVVQKQHNGSGVVLATGTPITNSISDCFIMQTYLQPNVLKEAGIDTFDSWALMFAEVVHDFEVDVDTSKFRMGNRFGKFHNLPELTRLLSGIADFHKAGTLGGLPTFNGYVDVRVPKSVAFQKFLEDISERADKVRNRLVEPSQDNMLVITTDGRKAALDLRIIDDDKYGEQAHSKSFECAKNVTKIYKEYNKNKATQLIFSDISTPNLACFNAYDEIKKNLVLLGIPENEIAYIHDADTESKRNRLFKLVNEGTIRILMGSTMKLGLGVNVQERLIAIHHVDVPWRPADMIQREGRIIRPGNTNEEVFIYRYITENSFDAYSWQILESKQNFISKLLSCDLNERSADDIDDSVLNYAEVKALAIGNPLIKERVEAQNNLNRLKNLERKIEEKRSITEAKVNEYKVLIPKRQKVYEAAVLDNQYIQANRPLYSKEEKKAIRDQIYRNLISMIKEKKKELLGTYLGFDIYSPGICPSDKTYIYLKRNGEYRLEIARNASGMMTRIENFLENLEDFALEVRDEIKTMKSFVRQANDELGNTQSYSRQIAYWTNKITELDTQLGISK